MRGGKRRKRGAGIEKIKRYGGIHAGTGYVVMGAENEGQALKKVDWMKTRREYGHPCRDRL